MFSPLPAENSPVLETITAKFNIIPSTSQAIKQTSKNSQEKRLTEVLPQTEIQMTPHKPKKAHLCRTRPRRTVFVNDVDEEEGECRYQTLGYPRTDSKSKSNIYQSYLLDLGDTLFLKNRLLNIF
ncbi:hypothetical protein TNCV_4164971 [Trichonephila clavipes]|nr:hypothetical protein TNCV_4164971 [Trichonephila clavipes]